MIMRIPTRLLFGAALSLAAASLLSAPLLSALSRRADAPKFFEDDPLTREPETQDASGVQEWDIHLVYDLAENTFGRPGDPASDVRARNINSIDEVPDSNWFTNRIGAKPLSIDEAVKGPLNGGGPAPGTWTVIRGKQAGVAPGFTMRDREGVTWFVSFDAAGFPDAATGAILVANRIFWSLGYWQPENHLVHVRPDELQIAEDAMIRPPSGNRRRMKLHDLDEVLRRSHRGPDGAYRAVAARALPGRVIGGFRYHGTRPDDPNDVVPHEHRRELRALKVFGAWTNLVDMKAGNTLDSLITENGRGVVRHYLQDVGSTFGTGALAPHDYDEGWEYLYEGDLVWKRMVTMGFYLKPWQTVDYERSPAIGRFEAEEFDPKGWKPRVPTAAFLRSRPDDEFWAARRVMAFSDDMIRHLAAAGRYSDESAAVHLADVLIKRRDKIGRAYLTAVNPVTDIKLDASGTLTFENAAVAAGVASEATQYTVSFAAFDNATGEATPLGPPLPTTERRVRQPRGLSSMAPAFVMVRIAASSPDHPAWAAPVDAYFRRSAGGWKLVGVERAPADRSQRTQETLTRRSPGAQ
jgi:hypothetical protein